MKRILIVGGGYAGVLCAARLARRCPEAAITLVNARPWFVERVRLHEDVAGEMRRRREIAEILPGAEIVVGTVSAIDLRAKTATVAERDIAFDELVVATGSVAKKAPAKAFPFATEQDMTAVRARIVDGARVVVVGGGLTGVELATELAGRGVEVRIVTDAEVAPSLNDAARAHVRRLLGARLVEHARVAAVEDGAVILESGDALPSDVTVWTGGFEAAPLSREAGLAVDELGRAIVDGRLRSVTHPFVHVIGDAARVDVRGEPLRMACATAEPMGAYAADEIAGFAKEPFRFGYFVQCVSLGRDDGLVQKVDDRDRATALWLDGRLAAWVKERICRFTVDAFGYERRGFGYVWPKGRRGEPALLPEHAS